MSPKKDGATAPAKKKGKSKLDRINERFVKFREYAREVHKLITAAGASAPTAVKDKVTAAALRADQAVAACNEVSEALLALHKAGWNPRIGGKDVFVAGSLVMVKPRHVEHYTDFFQKEDLFSLRVVEVKGKSARVEIFKDNMRGETLVLPSYRLQARDK